MLRRFFATAILVAGVIAGIPSAAASGVGLAHAPVNLLGDEWKPDKDMGSFYRSRSRSAPTTCGADPTRGATSTRAGTSASP